MKTVGALLKEARVARGLTLAHIEQETKIREKFLVSIEANEFYKLPSLSYAKGFIRNYAEYLGISSDLAMAFFRRQTQEAPKSSILPKGVSDPLDAPLFQLTPGRFIGILVSGLLLIFFFYFLRQYSAIRKLPALTVTAPQDQMIAAQDRVVVEGQTDSDATVTINGISTIVRDDGRFYEQISVSVGVNKIMIVATSKFGKTTTIVREVGFQQ
jgi:cytoskeletal protein RodZ